MTRVIKNTDGGEVAGMGRLAALNVADFAAQAARTVHKARQRADTMVAEATERAGRIDAEAAEAAGAARQAAHDEGYRAGRAAGEADGRADGAQKAFEEAMALFAQQSESLQATLTRTLDEISAVREDICAQARADLLDLSLAIADKVAGVRAAADIETAQANLTKAVERVAEASRLTVSAAPEQLDQLGQFAPDLFERLGRDPTVQWVADETLSAGDVVVRTAGGEVDGRVKTQIDNVVAALTGRVVETS